MWEIYRTWEFCTFWLYEWLMSWCCLEPLWLPVWHMLNFHKLKKLEWTECGRRLPGQGVDCIVHDSCQKCTCMWSPGRLSRSPLPPYWLLVDSGALVPRQRQLYSIRMIKMYAFRVRCSPSSYTGLYCITFIQKQYMMLENLSHMHFYIWYHPSLDW